MRTYSRWMCLVGGGALLLLPRGAAAQQERADIRRGNRSYYEGAYPEAEVNYRRAVDKNIGSYEANFNLAGALYKQGRYDDAAAIYTRLSQDGTDRTAQANTFYNLGNTYLQQRQLDEAIEAYKNALRINPGDTEAKFNLAYAKKLKEEDEDPENQDDQNNDGGGGGGGGGDDPDNPDGDDGDSDGDGGGGYGYNDPEEGDGDPDQNSGGGNDNRQDQNQQQQGQSPSREESERLLRAIQASEDNTKKRVDEQNAAAASSSRSGKQW